ncbi:MULTISPECIES: arginine--tRNA ligase [unclassified Marinobacterium]|jgi:arginyl-tRNA synthetase|uniref:arginine--tRNA ligase n=1 Tax=unclassified Marinobacterium TaxID=2644139 RepID=UPI0015683C80|nr:MULTISPECIES: arginine--tRNA ligase [unclassified Marinobacterium]NRP35884.1 Arginine--tRNA ligase [Marinobacterium sp. xm-d-579]NRP59813.1 Arginine--tRNA ligase [Marinobacterium sp. xm-d-564]NRQ01390.1 Arginine--tRNA ligase [Marinobacterium sp. xm-d-530]
MKEQIALLLNGAIEALKAEGKLPADLEPNIQVENTRDKAHGDLATNLAMTLAKPARQNPRAIAEMILQALPASTVVDKAEIAGPGFINFFVNDAAIYSVVADVLEQTDQFGRSKPTSDDRVQVEFVSANPTGPLHVGHGRGAAYGATLADLLEAGGMNVEREYYVNDAGRQMNILAVSVFLRYLELLGDTITFPANGYQGEYIRDIAASLKATQGDALQCSLDDLYLDVPADEPAGGDKELHIDGLIDRAQNILGAQYRTLFDAGLDSILGDIREDLGEFGVNYQCWFSERSLTSSGDVDEALKRLDDKGYLYEEGGNIWFKSTDFGDDKDRVVKRANGQTTYFASDIAYHMNKFERGFQTVINVWGADHHGYITRVKAAIQALGYDPERLVVKLVQFAILYRGSERVQMSTRSGSFVTLRELRDEVGNDACRFFYVTRKADQHMDFDLDLAKSESKDNPVYYIQYAHARICSVLRKLESEGMAWDQAMGLASLERLDSEAERDLVTALSKYPETVKQAAANFEPHQLANYLRDLASDYHAYYNGHKMLIEDEALRNARITLSMAVRQVIANGLTILGVSAPEQM